MGSIVDLFNLIFTYPILNGLVLLYHLFGDFALSIIVLTIVIKLILFPLTLRQLRSTKEMQVLQPQIAELRKKFAKDQQGLAVATQQLYKEHGVNPLAGCLPLLVQLPVLYGLFYALSNGLNTANVNTLNAHLYPFVQHFDKLPDLTFRWFSWLSFLPFNVNWTFPLNHPDPTHILPVLAGLATFVSLRMSQIRPVVSRQNTNAGGGMAADVSTQTMKTMQYIMPLFTVFIGWGFAAGLAMYWTVSSVFQAVQQYFVTGWGSLLSAPRIQLKTESNVVDGSVSTQSDTKSANERRIARERENGSNGSEESSEDDDAAEPPLNPTPTYTRKRRTSSNNSASARRRSAQRSRS